MFYRVKLYIDETLVGSGRMPPGATTVEQMKGDNGGMFIGGVPDDGTYDSFAASVAHFKGCIMDLMVNGK